MYSYKPHLRVFIALYMLFLLPLRIFLRPKEVRTNPLSRYFWHFLAVPWTKKSDAAERIFPPWHFLYLGLNSEEKPNFSWDLQGLTLKKWSEEQRFQRKAEMGDVSFPPMELERNLCWSRVQARTKKHNPAQDFSQDAHSLLEE